MSGSSEEVVVLTGATGTIGREQLARIVRAQGTRVICVVRGASDAEAAKRLNAALDDMPHQSLTAEQRSRITALRGDILQERLGLDPRRWEALAEETTRIVHGAANVSWSAPLEEARRINVGGTAQMLKLAELAAAKGGLRAFDYLSTVLVAGKRRGLIGEDELDSSAGYWSSYEQTKAEAERAVKAKQGTLPISVFRISMVVGDSRTGYTSRFNVMYWPLKMLSRGVFWIAPGDPAGVVDVVPVDFVADAIEALSADPTQRGKSFHIAAGAQNCSTIGELMELAADSMRIRRPILVNPVIFVSLVRPFLYAITWGKRRDAFNKAHVYVPYLSYKARFDVTKAQKVLSPLGINPPPVRTYFRTLIDYATATEWGKNKGVAGGAG